jgi:phage tail-like protein
MPLSLAAILGLNTRFLVEVDGVDLGGWGQCNGLTVEFKNVPIEEGGNYDYQTILPDKLQYSTVKLRRAMNAQDSAKVQQWLSTKVSTYMNSHSTGGGGTARITLCDANGSPVSTWRLRNVYPAKWDGPELDSMTAGIAMEKLELVHEGFL